MTMTEKKENKEAMQKRRRSRKHVPKDIWCEILSRLPIKYLLRCRSVNKRWRLIVGLVRRKIGPLPICGLLIKPNSTRNQPPMANESQITYISRSDEIVSSQTDSTNQIVNSSYDQGLLCNLTLDFTALFCDISERNLSLNMHGGLFLVRDNNCTYKVHDPASKETFVLPKSPMEGRFGSDQSKTGAGGCIFRRFPWTPVARVCHFFVMRFFNEGKVIEIYNSQTNKWHTQRSENSLGSILQNATWWFDDYVALKKNRSFQLFFLTDGNYGVEIKITSYHTPDDQKIYLYGFRLPTVVQGGYKNARLGECGGCLHLFYYRRNGVEVEGGGGIWIWKHDGGTTVDAWTKVLEITGTRQVCMPLAKQRLAKVVLGGGSVIPMAFHPNVPSVFLLVKSFIFVYHLIKDTLHTIAEVKDIDQHYNPTRVVLPYSPCISSNLSWKLYLERHKIIT